VAISLPAPSASPLHQGLALLPPFEERHQVVRIPLGDEGLPATIDIPASARGLVLLAQTDGKPPRSSSLLRTLEHAGFATLRFDLLTPSEGLQTLIAPRLRFDIATLVDRWRQATGWARQDPATAQLPIGYFAASTSAAAALVAATEPSSQVQAVVARGGRPDLAGPALEQLQAPTLLIVASEDASLVQLNQQALERSHGACQLAAVSGASHRFEEPGAQEEVAHLACEWFKRHLVRGRGEGPARES
jgi:putative phosphoribosyl transferase